MKSYGWFALTLLLGVGTGLYMSKKPWVDYGEQKRLAREATADMQNAERERAKYVRQTAAAERPSGREEIARERGYRRPNEIPLEDLK